MGVVTAPWSDLVLLLRYVSDSSAGSVLPLWISVFVLFLSVCLILLRLIVYFNWKLTQVEAEQSMTLKTSAISRTSSRSAGWRRSSSL